MRPERWFLAAVLSAVTCTARASVLEYGPFGQVTLYEPKGAPAHVALFVSGDGGWNQGVVDMARSLAELDTLVVGIDIRVFMKHLEAGEGKCTYPASDFEGLSQYVQKKLGFERYVRPILVGYSSGATLVYAVLVQAPPGTFQGAVSLGFCPDLLLSKPMCKGNGLEFRSGPKGKGVLFEPATTLEDPWAVLQGDADQVCEPGATGEFVEQVPRGTLVPLPKVGHGYSVPSRWLPQLKKAFIGVAGATPRTAAVEPSSDVSDLPLVEVQATGTPQDRLAIVISGDGGWTGLDRQVGRVLAGNGVPVVGLDALHYFWSRRTPDGAAADLARIVRHYLTAWKKNRVVLVGYSRGADVLPFMARRLPGDLLERVELVALLGPALTVGFELHLSDFLGKSHKDDLPILPEARGLAGRKILCVYGDAESETLCPSLPDSLATSVKMKGAHHFDGAYEEIGRLILRSLGP